MCVLELCIMEPLQVRSYCCFYERCPQILSLRVHVLFIMCIYYASASTDGGHNRVLYLPYSSYSSTLDGKYRYEYFLLIDLYCCI